MSPAESKARGPPPRPKTSPLLLRAVPLLLALAFVAWAARRQHACGTAWAAAVLKAVLVGGLTYGAAMAAAWGFSIAAFLAMISGQTAMATLITAVGLAVTIWVFVGGSALLTRCG